MRGTEQFVMDHYLTAVMVLFAVLVIWHFAGALFPLYSISVV